MMWGMRWTGTANYVFYALVTLGSALLWLFHRAPDQLARAERQAGRSGRHPDHPAGRQRACRCAGCDPLVPMTRPLTERERATFDGIKDNYTNAQRGEKQ